MLEHTIPLRGRATRALDLTDEEAVELHKKGYRFSIYRPRREQCHLSLPYETLTNQRDGTITIRQPDRERELTVQKNDESATPVLVRAAG